MITDISIDSTAPASPTAPDLRNSAWAFRLVADPMRAAMLQLLAVEALCVCHLQDELRAKQTLVSHHLRALREAGLVESEPSGRFTYYRLTPGALDAVASAMGQVAAASHAVAPKRPC